MSDTSDPRAVDIAAIEARHHAVVLAGHSGEVCDWDGRADCDTRQVLVALRGVREAHTNESAGLDNWRRRAEAAEAREAKLREALEKLLSYPGPVRMAMADHEGCLPGDCYVTAVRALLAEPTEAER